jgi:CSLREA domain-containing protein
VARPSRNLIALLAALGAVASVPASASASTITVTSTADTQAEDAACTLREAIVAANSNTESGNGSGGAPECIAGQAEPTQDTIQFTIAGAGPHVIEPGSDLPNLTQLVTINGATDGTDEIQLDGSSSGGGSGLVFGSGSDGSTITGMTIHSFDGGNGISTSSADNNTISNSFIGTDEAGTDSLGNGTGISVPSSGNTVTTNVISGNESLGVEIQGSGNTLTTNRIGPKPAVAATALPNGGGVRLAGQADSTTIGGDLAIEGNQISGNSGNGIFVLNGDSDPISGVVIQRNLIGTTLNGQAELGNTNNGIALQGNVAAPEIRQNLISGNDADGITMFALAGAPVGDPAVSDAVIVGNKVGTDVDAEDAIANGGNGIAIGGATGHPSAGNQIGGPNGLTPGGACTGDCNVVASSGNIGIALSTGADDTIVLGNHIGTDGDGTGDLGSTADGVNISAEGVRVGSAAAPNTISGNGSSGVSLSDPAAGAIVQGNRIGTGSDGTTALGNDDDGVQISTEDGNLVGGLSAGDGNLIRNSGGAGIHIFAGVDNALLGNSTAGNTGLGIELEPDGVTPNDAGDVDAGPNDLQNFPILAAAVADGDTTVAGTLSTTPNTDFRIEVFGMDAEDGTQHGEGEEFLGAFDVSTDSAGDASLGGTVDGAAGPGESVTATATELDGSGNPLSTSEFALNITEGCDIEGTSGDDPALTGTAADEVICGFDGEDVIDGAGGEDVILGGEGDDEVDYSAAAAEVVVDLLTGFSSGGGGGSDLLTGIEDVKGSDFDDEITGDDLANVLKGRDGKDTLITKDGKDKLRGGDGGDDLDGGKGDKDDLDGDDGKDEFDGGKGDKDDCDGGPDKDRKPAKGCEKKKSIP